MRILAVAYNDADNLTIEPVLRELERRGHQVTIFAPYTDDQSVRMFRELKAEIRPFCELTPETARQFDAAFCTVMMMERLVWLDVYCFVYSQYFEEYYMTDGADFLFTHRRGCIPRCDFRCATMEVGDTKNDGSSGGVTEEKKQILFIDSGHIPFGKKGKEQIADMLLEVCRAFPDHTLCIKPRWLREGQTHYSHQNACHLYDVLEERCGDRLPANLVMLNEHRDLQELIDESHCVITLYTGATLNVMARGKGLLVLSGWDSDDKWDMRNAVVMAGKERMYARSGCLVDIRDVTKYLPDGLFANEAFCREMTCRDRNASRHMADVMEHVYETCLCEGRYPATGEYEYEAFRESIVPDPTLTLEDLKYERVRDVLQKRIATLSYEIAAPVDFSGYYKKLDAVYRDYAPTGEGFGKISMDFGGLQNEILIEQGALLQNDAIDQSFWLQALFNAGKEEELLRLDADRLLDLEAYHYYLGMICARHNEPQQAIEHFAAYAEKTNKRPYIKFIQGCDMEYTNAYRYLLETYDGENIPPARAAHLFFGLYRTGREELLPLALRERAMGLLVRKAGELARTVPDPAERLLWDAICKLRIRNDELSDEKAALNENLRQAVEKERTLSKGVLGKCIGALRCIQENGWLYTVRLGSQKVARRFRGSTR